MTKRIVVLAGLALTLLAPSASAWTVPVPPPTRLIQAPCPDGSEPEACAAPDAIYIPPSVASPGDPRWSRVWWHERGHQADSYFLDDADREAFTELLGEAGRPWWGAPGHYYWGVPGEQFADAYMLCSLHLETRGRSKRLADGLVPEYLLGTSSGFEASGPYYRRVCNWIAAI